MPNKAAHARLWLTASRGAPPSGAAEHQPLDCGCQQAVHITLQPQGLRSAAQTLTSEGWWHAAHSPWPGLQ